MSKGDGARVRLITRTEWEANYERTFRKAKQCDGCGDYALREVEGTPMWWCESCKKWREPHEPHPEKCGSHAGDPCTCTDLRADQGE